LNSSLVRATQSADQLDTVATVIGRN